MCEMACDVPGTEIFYTIDDSFPDKFSPKYTAPIEIPQGEITLRIVTLRNGQPTGRMLMIPRAALEKRVEK